MQGWDRTSSRPGSSPCPNSVTTRVTQHLNNGFILEEYRQIDPEQRERGLQCRSIAGKSRAISPSRQRADAITTTGSTGRTAGNRRPHHRELRCPRVTSCVASTRSAISSAATAWKWRRASGSRHTGHQRCQERPARKLGPVSPAADGRTRSVAAFGGSVRRGVPRYLRHARQRHVRDAAGDRGALGRRLVTAVRPGIPSAVHA